MIHKGARWLLTLSWYSALFTNRISISLNAFQNSFVVIIVRQPIEIITMGQKWMSFFWPFFITLKVFPKQIWQLSSFYVSLFSIHVLRADKFGQIQLKKKKPSPDGDFCCKLQLLLFRLGCVTRVYLTLPSGGPEAAREAAAADRTLSLVRTHSFQGQADVFVMRMKLGACSRFALWQAAATARDPAAAYVSIFCNRHPITPRL